MEKFTAREVRQHGNCLGSPEREMLYAYADLLEAQEKAVPFGYAYRYWDGIRFDTGGREINGSKPTATIPLYTHPSPADAERLAEALRNLVEASHYADAPDEHEAAEAALAAHSAQAQPPVVSVPGELAEPSKGVLNYEQELSFAEGWNACRAAMLAAQENPNG